MRFYAGQHRFYCGVDRHARTLRPHLLDHDWQTRFGRNIPDRPDRLLDASESQREVLDA